MRAYSWRVRAPTEGERPGSTERTTDVTARTVDRPGSSAPGTDTGTRLEGGSPGSSWAVTRCETYFVGRAGTCRESLALTWVSPMSRCSRRTERTSHDRLADKFLDLPVGAREIRPAEGGQNDRTVLDD